MPCLSGLPPHQAPSHLNVEVPWRPHKRSGFALTSFASFPIAPPFPGVRPRHPAPRRTAPHVLSWRLTTYAGRQHTAPPCSPRRRSCRHPPSQQVRNWELLSRVLCVPSGASVCDLSSRPAPCAQRCLCLSFPFSLSHRRGHKQENLLQASHPFPRGQSPNFPTKPPPSPRRPGRPSSGAVAV